MKKNAVKIEKKDSSKLSPKHDDFLQKLAQEYDSNGLNMKQAYKKLRPEVKDSTAEVEGSKLLVNPKFKAFLAEERRISSEKYDITRESVLQDLIQIDNQAKLTDNLKIRVQIAQEKLKIFGLYAPTKSEVDSKITEYKIISNIDD